MEKQIFECSIFQNMIENLLLFFEMNDEEILEFYHKVSLALTGKQYQMLLRMKITLTA